MRPLIVRLFITLLLLASLPQASSARLLASSPARLVATAPAQTPHVLLELDEPPTIAVAAQAQHGALTPQSANTARGALARIESRQQVLMRSLSQLGATILYRTQRVYNGIAVAADPQTLLELAKLPGIKAVHPLPAYHPALTRSVPFIGAPSLWGGQNLTGAGIKIGIIDTGIDYTHADFGGSGSSADFSKNDATIITDNVTFPTAKVVAGYDFVGDTYDTTSNNPAQLVPHPDPDPIDCYGHGTHVAGIAAGAGVTSAGATYTGPYNATLNASAFGIGPGVAPQAQLVALKVFGCTGSSDIIAPAIEYAVDPNGDGDFSDHLDVINMSLGSSASPNDDAQSQASDNAALAGVVVVTAAGNDGDTFYSSGGPGNAVRALSVAATARDTNVLANFSSRGPGNPDSGLKPEIAAPGASIFSAKSGSGTGGFSLSGTSMATPHMAGSMALLKQLHPSWSVEELKALAMNTAGSVRDSSHADAGISRVGAGLINLPNAAAGSVLAYAADGFGAVGVSFGSLEVTRTTTLTRTIRVANKSAASATYQLAYSPRATVPGATYTILPSAIALGANSSSNITVTLTLDPTVMQHTHDAAVPETQVGMSRFWLSEAGGDLTLTPTGATTATAHLPLYAAPRAAAQMHAVTSTLDFTLMPTFSAALALNGNGLAANAPPLNATSLVSALELAYRSPLLATTVGRNADVQYVGVASDVHVAGSLDASTLYFGIATYADWASPHQVEFDILIDTNRDGIDDFLLAENSAGGMSDVYQATLFRISNNIIISSKPLNGLRPSDFDTAPFNTNVMLLPVSAHDLGLTSAAPRFNYHVVTYSTDRSDGEFADDRAIYGAPIDQTPTLSYDAANLGFDLANRALSGVPIYADLPHTTIPFTYNRAAYIGNTSQGVLLLHYHNTFGQRAEALSPVLPVRTLLPLVSK